jgi:hypothetical protein
MGGCFNTHARARDTPIALVAGRCLLALLASGLGSSVGAPPRNLEISKSRLGGSALSASLSAPRRPPNFLGLRRSTHFGLACGAEGRKQSKQIGDYPLLQGVVGVIQFSVLSPSSSLALGSALSPSQLLVGHQIFSACGAKGRKQSKQIGDHPLPTPSGGGGGGGDPVLSRCCVYFLLLIA